jgi:hypothetical protein
MPAALPVANVASSVGLPLHPPTSERTSFAACPRTHHQVMRAKAKLVIRRAYGHKSFRNYRLRLLS